MCWKYLSMLFTHGNCLQTSSFWGRPFELDRLSLLARIEHLIAQDCTGAKISDPYVVFHSDENDDGIGSKHWSLLYQWDARIYFGTSAFSCTVFDAMVSTCPSGQDLPCFCCNVEQFETLNVFSHLLISTPSFKLPNWLNSNKVWCEINHAIFDPLHSHFSRIAITTVIRGASAIFQEIFLCIKRTTSQTVQSNCTNSMYSFRSKVI